jgi:hypothetical protein
MMTRCDQAHDITISRSTATVVVANSTKNPKYSNEFIATPVYEF